MPRARRWPNGRSCSGSSATRPSSRNDDAPMKLAILGGGHGCYAAAADLAEAGHEVMLWRRDAAALAPLVAHGSILLKDAAGARDVAIAGASADIGAVVRGAELIVIPSPAIAQADIARALAPH